MMYVALHGLDLSAFVMGRSINLASVLKNEFHSAKGARRISRRRRSSTWTRARYQFNIKFCKENCNCFFFPGILSAVFLFVVEAAYCWNYDVDYDGGFEHFFLWRQGYHYYLAL